MVLCRPQGFSRSSLRSSGHAVTHDAWKERYSVVTHLWSLFFAPRKAVKVSNGLLCKGCFRRFVLVR